VRFRIHVRHALHPRTYENTFTPAEGNEFLRAINICSTTYLGVEVKPSVPYSSISRHGNRIPRVWKRYLVDKIRRLFPRPSFFCFAAGNCQRALVDESGMIRNKMGTHNTSETVVVQWSPCAPTPQGLRYTSRHRAHTKGLRPTLLKHHGFRFVRHIKYL
jgi:hypothetical protein